MRWTIGMPSYANLTEVYFTVQSLRMYHDLTDCEIVVVDNSGDTALASVCKSFGAQVRYDKYTSVVGVSAAKNRVFEIARGDYVMCIDSHILVQRGALDILPTDDDIVQGPLICSDNAHCICAWEPTWRAQMWGIMGPKVERTALPTQPFPIWAQGAGFFACKRKSWLGFNPAFRGFGGETGYIQEKYRRAGRRVLCYPGMGWMHFFYGPGHRVPHRVDVLDRVRNYWIGFNEIGLDTEPIRQHFGSDAVKRALAKYDKRI